MVRGLVGRRRLSGGVRGGGRQRRHQRRGAPRRAGTAGRGDACTDGRGGAAVVLGAQEDGRQAGGRPGLPSRQLQPRQPSPCRRQGRQLRAWSGDIRGSDLHGLRGERAAQEGVNGRVGGGRRRGAAAAGGGPGPPTPALRPPQARCRRALAAGPLLRGCVPLPNPPGRLTSMGG